MIRGVATGLLVTRPARVVVDLLGDLEDPGAVARIVADAIRRIFNGGSPGPDAVRRPRRGDPGS